MVKDMELMELKVYMEIMILAYKIICFEWMIIL